jgi:Fe-S-cluster containining protein
MSQGEGVDFALNGLSVNTITLSQDGNLEVTFDLPVEQSTPKWYAQLLATRTFDVYEDEELKEACRRLFEILRSRVSAPDPERLAIHCDRCKSADCCRKYNVLLRPEDIERLGRRFGLSSAELTEKYTVPAVDWASDFARQLAADADEHGEEKCIFLKQNESGRWRCSVYEHRPQACRDFDMKACNDFVPIEDVVARGRRLA